MKTTVILFIATAVIVLVYGFTNQSPKSTTPAPITLPAMVEISINGKVGYSEIYPGETVHLIFDDGELRDVQFLDVSTPLSPNPPQP